MFGVPPNVFVSMCANLAMAALFVDLLKRYPTLTGVLFLHESLACKASWGHGQMQTKFQCLPHQLRKSTRKHSCRGRCALQLAIYQEFLFCFSLG